MSLIHTLVLPAALAMTALPLVAVAQASAPAEVAASAAPAPPPGPRVLTPQDQRNKANAAAAPDLRPERPVVPQISLPLGRTPPAPTPSPRPPRSGAAAPPGHIGDAAARCESLPGDLERASCRKRLAQAKPPV